MRNLLLMDVHVLLIGKIQEDKHQEKDYFRSVFLNLGPQHLTNCFADPLAMDCGPPGYLDPTLTTPALVCFYAYLNACIIPGLL